MKLVQYPLSIGVLATMGMTGICADEQPSPADWMKEARIGAMIHFLPGKTSFVDLFDAAGFAKQMEWMGAKYVIFTLGQNGGVYNSPNATYDRVTGYAPGERCAKRDLPLDLYQELHPKGIRLMLYLPVQVPSTDKQAQKAFGLKPGVHDQKIDAAFAKRWAEVIYEWSARYGDKVAGWWIDGAYGKDGFPKGYGKQVEFTEEIAGIYADAVKRGNPKAIVTFNGGLRVVRYTQVEDYTAGEQHAAFKVVPTEQRIDGAQWHTMTYLGSDWVKRDVRHDLKSWRDWYAKIIDKGGALTLDVGPNYSTNSSPIGLISEVQVNTFRAIAQTSTNGASLQTDEKK